MAIDLSSYYNYLNNFSVNTKNTINSQSAVQGLNSSVGDEHAASSEFEMALLSMLQTSSTAYDKVSEYNAQNSGYPITSSSVTSDAQELYDQLSSILDSYNQLKNNPSSLAASLFSSLNKENSDASGSSDTLSDLHLLNILNNTSTE